MSKSNLRTFEPKIIKKVKNTESWPKLSGSYEKNVVQLVVPGWSCNLD